MKRALTLLSVSFFAVTLLAQAPSNAPVTGRDKGQGEHRKHSANNDAQTSGAAASEKSSHRSTRVWSDATRLATLLHDVQTEVTVSAAMWRTIANEANTLANRIYANTTRSKDAHAAARDLRMHVREMRTAALRGDAAGARKHASEAMPFVYKVIDWAD